MQLSQIKNLLATVQNVAIELEDGTPVPKHFHVTEVGVITKHFIDCGGVERKEKVVNFQLWDANDYDHRLQPTKLHNIIVLAEKQLQIDPDLEIEVEYQGKTIEKYGLTYTNKKFVLLSKKTNCLAQDNCGITPVVQVNENVQSCCSPNSGCC